MSISLSITSYWLSGARDEARGTRNTEPRLSTLDPRPSNLAPHPAPHRIVGKALLRHAGGVIHVAAVEEHRLGELALDQVEVRGAEALPLGDDHQGVGALQGRLLGAAQVELV